VLEMGYPAHAVYLVTKLYIKQKAMVKVAGTTSSEFESDAS